LVYLLISLPHWVDTPVYWYELAMLHYKLSHNFQIADFRITSLLCTDGL
ncbi:9009_t:CDS:1, partial [Racocetra persica]